MIYLIILIFFITSVSCCGVKNITLIGNNANLIMHYEKYNITTYIPVYKNDEIFNIIVLFYNKTSYKYINIFNDNNNSVAELSTRGFNIQNRNYTYTYNNITNRIEEEYNYDEEYIDSDSDNTTENYNNTIIPIAYRHAKDNVEHFKTNNNAFIKNDDFDLNINLLTNLLINLYEKIKIIYPIRIYNNELQIENYDYKKCNTSQYNEIKIYLQNNTITNNGRVVNNFIKIDNLYNYINNKKYDVKYNNNNYNIHILVLIIFVIVFICTLLYLLIKK
jgi:hypothetical protein